jgi:hypothetical protein
VSLNIGNKKAPDAAAPRFRLPNVSEGDDSSLPTINSFWGVNDDSTLQSNAEPFKINWKSSQGLFVLDIKLT